MVAASATVAPSSARRWIASQLALVVAAWASVASAACPPERPGARTVLLVLARDPALDRHAADVERAVRRAAAERLALLGPEATARALSIEGGADERERAVVEARVVLARAEDRFRELDDEEALGLIAKVTTKLGSVHQEPDAIAMLTRAHLLAGAIFLARGRIDAARQRLQRALDLDPALSPPRDRFAPEVLAELAAVRASAALRPVGRLEVRTSTPGADVFVDGHAIGATPLVVDAVPAGNHLLRISAPGRTSHVETIAIAPEVPRIVAVELADDPELGAIAGLRAALARDEDPKSVLALVARRAGADEAMLASFALSPELSATGTATIGVTLELSSRGRAWSPSLDRAALGRALDAARRCDEEGLGQPRAAALGLSRPRTSAPEPVPDAPSVYARPWFWAVAAVVAIGTAGAFVVGRTAGGPPEAVEIRLVPRP